MNKLIFKTAEKIFKRDKEKLLLSFTSLFVGALVLTVVLGLVNSVRSYIDTKSKELIGGDLVIQQSFPIDIKKSESIQKFIEGGSTYAEKIQTLVTFNNTKKDKNVLAAVRAVTSNHPLYGNLELASGKTNLPKDNEIYAEKTFFEKLGIHTGDNVLINNVSFKAVDTIIREPDRFGSGFSFGPRVIMTQQGWKNTKIDSSASRITYTVSLKVPEKLLTDQNIKETEKEFKEDGAQITNSKKGPTQLNNIIDAWERFFLSITVLTLFLIMVNIRSNLIYLLSYFTKTISVFRVLGMRQKDIVSIFAILLFVVSFAAGIVGNIFGNSLIYFLIPYIEKIVSTPLPKPLIISSLPMITIFTVLLCFLSSLSAFMKILQIEPKMILANNLAVKTTFKSFSREAIISILIILGLFGGIYYLTERLSVAIISVLSIAIVFAVFIGIIKLIIYLIYRNKFRLSFSGRSIINFVKNQGLVGETALASLTLAFACIFSIALIQYNITENLEGPLRNKVPNLYVIDVQEEQVKPMKEFFKGNINLFPNIRARLTRIDDRDIQDNDKEDGELKREFNLTYRTDLITGEKLVEGKWHGTTGKNEVSLEKRFAERANIKLGSEVEFLILGIPVQAKVTSIRTVDSSQGLPFFFFVFSPDVIQDAPQSFFGYTFLADEKISGIQSDLVKKFPNVFSLPTNEIINTVKTITDTILTAVLTVSVPALILGVLLIFAMLVNSARERFKDLLVFKVFGATQKKVFRLYLMETLFFILFSSIFAMLFSLGATTSINTYFFKFQNFYFNRQIFVIVLIVLSFAILFSVYLIRKMFVKTPASLFRS